MGGEAARPAVTGDTGLATAGARDSTISSRGTTLGEASGVAFALRTVGTSICRTLALGDATDDASTIAVATMAPSELRDVTSRRRSMGEAVARYATGSAAGLAAAAWPPVSGGLREDRGVAMKDEEVDACNPCTGTIQGLASGLPGAASTTTTRLAPCGIEVLTKAGRDMSRELGRVGLTERGSCRTQTGATAVCMGNTADNCCSGTATCELDAELPRTGWRCRIVGKASSSRVASLLHPALRKLLLWAIPTPASLW